MTSQPSLFTDCRFCLEKKRHVLPINEEMNNVYFSVTQMKLARLHSYSNAVCLLCYKKLLSAQSYREMLVQIEQKLLTTFNHTQLKQTPQNKAIRSNGAPRTPLSNPPDITKKFARQQMKQHATTVSNEDEDDMSLLEEIVSFDTPHGSDFINEQEHDNQFSMMSGDEEFDDDASSSYQVKDEPADSPVMDVNDDDKGWNQQINPDKPFKCTYPGCRQSSTSRTALLKHRRRVHGIRMRQSLGGGKITRSRPSQLYNDLELSCAEFKCKFCSLNLRNRRVLLRHIETVHMQAKFYCTVPGCNHASTRKDNYRLHLKNYHRDLPEEQMEQVLAETRDMKPIYENNLLELQIKRDQLKSELNGDEEPASAVVDETEKNVQQLPGFSIIDISGGEFE